MPDEIVLFWFRRDLRLSDNAGLYYALTSGLPVLPVFIFDTEILEDLGDKKDKRVSFIHDTLQQMIDTLRDAGSNMQVLHGTPLASFQKLAEQYTIRAVYTNNDYEPYAIQRDQKIATYLKGKNIAFHSFKDQVIFEKDEVVKSSGDPYTVFTPYSKRWKELLNGFYLKPYPCSKYYSAFIKQELVHIPSLQSLGFEYADYHISPAQLNVDVARDYSNARNYPAADGTTHLGIHLRFGTISIRALAAQVQKLSGTLLNELIWREFYQMILWHFPHVVNHSFKKEYDNINWRNDETEFKLWRTGNTGYPIVDAGMRQLNETGYMHNRVRMITASFLTKDLLIDWRWGEAYFAEKLLDYDLAANNGGWQWSAGSGCDAAPYFRIFNPELQTEKFDPLHKYIDQWVPEIATPAYPTRVVDHKQARERCLAVYKAALTQR
ncbi:MAG: deoxyribodipyrimidine photo-lyase [Taibaiella sp.]|nr:deoxyribodipyrimidine photo-lyase [Taibaiella sp.]